MEETKLEDLLFPKLELLQRLFSRVPTPGDGPALLWPPCLFQMFIDDEGSRLQDWFQRY